MNLCRTFLCQKNSILEKSVYNCEDVILQKRERYRPIQKYFLIISIHFSLKTPLYQTIQPSLNALSHTLCCMYWAFNLLYFMTMDKKPIPNRGFKGVTLWDDK